MRLRSLDVFRGLTMAGMVIVNNPGDRATVYAPLLHAGWHGVVAGLWLARRRPHCAAPVLVVGHTA